MSIFQNHLLIAAVLGWFFAQSIKFFLTWFQERRIDWTRIMGAGGMPSSHSSFVCALATSAGLNCGFASAAFAISTAFALIVMHDAQGVRQDAGKQAAVLNEIMDYFEEHLGWKDQKLRELIGHTPFQVIAGAVLGVAVSIIYQQLI
ncbi:divergent PAP2 family protein [Gehongia tenuis]|uniref:Divergent PAP2 family protein n=1 Tax=Gehongia tenuis TaxID=2763655 RepID=A0A926HQE4_9FIRM|nr:divergent PAP2 family protein [Gehongia tenuis]MBC8531171.1 divergent PAP2 family protein [Gehongia tenuis]